MPIIYNKFVQSIKLENQKENKRKCNNQRKSIDIKIMFVCNEILIKKFFFFVRKNI